MHKAVNEDRAFDAKTSMRQTIDGLRWTLARLGFSKRAWLGLPALLGVLLLVLAGMRPAVAVGAQPQNPLPERPGPVSAIPLTTQQVYLSWPAPANTTSLPSYIVTRDGRDVASVPAGTFNYADNSVQASTTYVYSVTAVDPSGHRSQPSPAIRAVAPALPETADTTPPTPPENLAAAAGPGKITLAWEDSNDDTGIGGYFVHRDGNLIATLDPATRSFVDTNVQPSTRYTYLVEAIDVVGHHSQPSPVTVTTGQFSQPRGSASSNGSALSELIGRLTFIAFGARTSAAIGGAAATTTLAPGYNAALRRYPYLTDLVQGYATVNWATDTSGKTGSVTYGQVGSEACTAHSVAATSTTMSVNSATEYQWKAMLTLTPGTQYCYRVYLGTTDLLGSNAAPSFRTQVPAGSTQPFSFAVLGDWGAVDTKGSNANQANLMSQLAASGALFAVTVGDNAYPSGSQSEYGDLVQTGSNTSAIFGPQFYAKVGASMAIFPSIGNHGMARSETNHPHLQNWPQDRAASTSGGRYTMDTYCCINRTSSASYPSTWYAFDAGIARIYILEAAWPDSNLGTGTLYSDDHGYHWTASSAEYQWLKTDLQTHTSPLLKFAVFHFPIYSENAGESSDTYLQGTSSLEGLLSQYGVSIVFDGHAHGYEHFLRPHAGSEMSYVSGGGGAPLSALSKCSSFDQYGLGWSDSSNAGSSCHASRPTSASQVYHYLLVTVNGTTVTIAAKNAAGQTFDVNTYTFGAVSATPTPTPTPTPTSTPTPTPTVTATSAAPPIPGPTSVDQRYHYWLPMVNNNTVANAPATAP